MASSSKKITKDSKASKGKRKRKLSGSEDEGPAFLSSKYAEPPISKIYNSRFSNNTPAELFRKDLISAMKMPDSEPLTPDEYLLIEDAWKPEWEKGVQVPVNPDSLPETNIRVLRKRRKDPNFKFPKKLIRFTRDKFFSIDTHVMSYTAALSERVCRYDMDDVDYQWLSMINEDREDFGLTPIAEITVEQVIEELEEQCHENFQEAMRTESATEYFESDDDAVCDVCRSPDSEEGNEIVFCDSCNMCVHQSCYGITRIPEGSWICRTCALGVRPTCILCPNRGGAMKTTRNGQKWCHVSCAIWVPEVSISCVEKMEPVTKISQIPAFRWALVCVICRKKNGACIQCAAKFCKTAYHVTCAFQEGLTMRAIMGGVDDDTLKLKSFCPKHSKKKLLSSDSESEEMNKMKSQHIKKETGMSHEEKLNAREQRIQEREELFFNYINIDEVTEACQCERDVVELIYNYWKLKRKANFSRPLLPPRVVNVDTNTFEENSTYSFVKKLVHLRQDLERVRNLCYMVNKREKMSRSWIEIKREIFLKQSEILSDNSLKLSSDEYNAVVSANYGDFSYDKKYTGENGPSPNTLRVLNTLVGEEYTKTQLNGIIKTSKKRANMCAKKNSPNPYAKHYLNGLLKRSQRWLATVHQQKNENMYFMGEEVDSAKNQDSEHNTGFVSSSEHFMSDDGFESSKDCDHLDNFKSPAKGNLDFSKNKFSQGTTDVTSKDNNEAPPPELVQDVKEIEKLDVLENNSLDINMQVDSDTVNVRPIKNEEFLEIPNKESGELKFEIKKNCETLFENDLVSHEPKKDDYAEDVHDIPDLNTYVTMSNYCDSFSLSKILEGNTDESKVSNLDNMESVNDNIDRKENIKTYNFDVKLKVSPLKFNKDSKNVTQISNSDASPHWYHVHKEKHATKKYKRILQEKKPEKTANIIKKGNNVYKSGNKLTENNVKASGLDNKHLLTDKNDAKCVQLPVTKHLSVVLKKEELIERGGCYDVKLRTNFRETVKKDVHDKLSLLLNKNRKESVDCSFSTENISDDRSKEPDACKSGKNNVSGSSVEDKNGAELTSLQSNKTGYNCESLKRETINASVVNSKLINKLEIVDGATDSKEEKIYCDNGVKNKGKLYRLGENSESTEKSEVQSSVSENSKCNKGDKSKTVIPETRFKYNCKNRDSPTYSSSEGSVKLDTLLSGKKKLKTIKTKNSLSEKSLQKKIVSKTRSVYSSVQHPSLVNKHQTLSPNKHIDKLLVSPKRPVSHEYETEKSPPKSKEVIFPEASLPKKSALSGYKIPKKVKKDVVEESALESKGGSSPLTTLPDVSSSAPVTHYNNSKNYQIRARPSWKNGLNTNYSHRTALLNCDTESQRLVIKLKKDPSDSDVWKTDAIPGDRNFPPGQWRRTNFHCMSGSLHHDYPTPDGGRWTRMRGRSEQQQQIHVPYRPRPPLT